MNRLSFSAARFRPAAIAVLALCPCAGYSYIVTVGTPAQPDGSCDCGTIQCAFDLAAAEGGFHEVRLTDTLSYFDENDSITLNADDVLALDGGFADCDPNTVSIGMTRVGGSRDDGGGTRAPVFTFNGYGEVYISNLHITEGDAYGSSPFDLRRGGGIRSQGFVNIHDSEIDLCKADLGGGIYAEGGLYIGENVLIHDNTAVYNGGGVVVAGPGLTMESPGSAIYANAALGTTFNGLDTGFGGGLYLTGADNTVNLSEISAAGPDNSPADGIADGAIHDNTAKYGGGVAVIGSEADYAGNTTLKLISTLAYAPTAINNNIASIHGGGVYLKSAVAFDSIHQGDLVAGNFAHIDGNTAADGAAVYIDYTSSFGYHYGASMSMDKGSISGNTSTNASGSIVRAADDCGLTLNRVQAVGNAGAPFVHSNGRVIIQNALIAGNESPGTLLLSSGGDASDYLNVFDSTLAGNSLGGNSVVGTTTDFQLLRSILDAPGITSVENAGGSVTAQYVVTSERISLDGGNTPYVIEAAPRFVDPVDGDFTLRAASLAVDFSPAVGGLDLAGAPRDVNLPFKANFYGPRDLGAYERQALQPLVINGDFAGDLRVWDALSAFAEWTGDDHAASGASGSLHIGIKDALPGNSVVVGSQCIHLPGPGRYSLNGWTHRGASTGHGGDSGRLTWAYRRAGGEACTDGAADGAGQLALGNSASWTQAAAPATIDVPATDWTFTSSITVSVVAVDGNALEAPGVSVWFDDITLDVASLNDLIFADGFD